MLVLMAVSCEPGRTKAYSEDLRWKMVWQSEGLGLSNRAVAKRLCVDPSTVSRTVGLFHATGSVSKRPYPKERAARTLTEPCKLLILHVIMQKPGILLSEIQKEIEEVLWVQVSLSAICKFIHQSGFTRQRLRNVATQQDPFEREQFISDVSVYDPEMLVFIDETGADRRNTLRKYGYSMRGKPAVNHSFLVRGERISAIACISLKGLLDVKTVRGTSNGDIFYDFIQENLLSHLMPFNGTNAHSVVILDNCAIHHTAEVKSLLKGVGVLVHFLPPYSPDFNPIEEAFSKVKSDLKTHLDDSMTDVETLLLTSFTSITSQDCHGWIAHPGIYNL